eukprot:s4_g13.t1
MALGEGPTPNPRRGVVGMVLEEEAAERGIALKVMELVRKRWNIRGAAMGEAAVGRDAQAGLVLVERLVAAVGSLFCCVVFRSPPLGGDGLGLQPNGGAGKSFKDREVLEEELKMGTIFQLMLCLHSPLAMEVEPDGREMPW